MLTYLFVINCPKAMVSSHPSCTLLSPGSQFQKINIQEATSTTLRRRVIGIASVAVWRRRRRRRRQRLARNANEQSAGKLPSWFTAIDIDPIRNAFRLHHLRLLCITMLLPVVSRIMSIFRERIVKHAFSAK